MELRRIFRIPLLLIVAVLLLLFALNRANSAFAHQAGQ
jgi:hypothetical protein